jgi:amidase
MLHGVPLGIKDVIDTADMPTELGTVIHRGRRPARDAACVLRARRSGAVVLGKTVATELAYFAPGKTANPHDPAHTPGGSSSGSAAAVADRMVPAAFGTQTAASVIRPAAFCGVVGVRPSRGWFSLDGITPFAPSFDTLGLITRSVVDARYLRASLLGAAFIARPEIAAPRIGVCRTPWWQDADADCHAAIECAAAALERAGATVTDVELPTGFERLVDWHRAIISYAAATSYRREYDGHRDRLSESLCALIEQGSALATDRYEALCADARAARGRFARMMRDVDVLLTPSAKGEAPRGLAATGDPLFSRPWMVLDAPSVTLPGFEGARGLPIGVQLVGACGDDERMLAIAQWAERAIAGATGSGEARAAT